MNGKMNPFGFSCVSFLGTRGPILDTGTFLPNGGAVRMEGGVETRGSPFFTSSRYVGFFFLLWLMVGVEGARAWPDGVEESFALFINSFHVDV